MQKVDRMTSELVFWDHCLPCLVAIELKPVAFTFSNIYRSSSASDF